MRVNVVARHQALHSATLRDELQEMLLGPGQLYEALRVDGAARAQENSPAAGSWMCSAQSAEHVRRPGDKPLKVIWWAPLEQ